MNVVKWYNKKDGIKAIEATCLIVVYKYMEDQNAYYPIPPTISQLSKLLNLKSDQSTQARVKGLQGHGFMMTVPYREVGGTALTRKGVSYARHILARGDIEEYMK